MLVLDFDKISVGGDLFPAARGRERIPTYEGRRIVILSPDKSGRRISFLNSIYYETLHYVQDYKKGN